MADWYIATAGKNNHLIWQFYSIYFFFFFILCSININLISEIVMHMFVKKKSYFITKLC